MAGMSRKEYDELEKSQTVHRSLNSLMTIAVLVLGYFFITSELKPVYEKFTGIEDQKLERQEISQIMNDESVRTCQYKDSLGNATIGVGHLVKPSEELPRCITTHKAIELLQQDYRYAKSSVEKRYPWAEGEVKLVLINMSFQLGENRLANFKKTLKYLEEEDYPRAASEVLDSELFRQAPNRVVRHSARILSLTQH